LAKQLDIPQVPFSEIDFIDITIDGADEVDNDLNLIKGGGGALLREKILAFHSKKFVVIIDESKRYELLGGFPLPVEIVDFASNLTIDKLKALNCDPKIRMVDEKPYMTDNGNLIVDCSFEEIRKPEQLNDQLKAIPGVVENGLFVNMVSTLVIGYKDGTVKVVDKTN
jgi:ribose 5-phosphate isomerase A